VGVSHTVNMKIPHFHDLGEGSKFKYSFPFQTEESETTYPTITVKGSDKYTAYIPEGKTRHCLFS
jgi:hypothetical protein